MKYFLNNFTWYALISKHMTGFIFPHKNGSMKLLDSADSKLT